MREIFSKARVFAEQLTADAFKFVSDVYKQTGDVFTVASPYGQIITVMNQLSNMILFYIEDSITEMDISTANRPESIYGLARLTGHNSTRAISASGEIQLSLMKTPSIQGSKVVIANYSKIKCINNNAFYILNLPSDELVIDITSKVPVYANVLNGEINTQQFTGDGTQLQSFNVNAGKNNIDHFYVRVYVNGTRWKNYDSLYDIPFEANGCLVKTGISGGVDIYFGNGNFGSVPHLGAEIRVDYLLTGGLNGNIEESTNVQFQWIDFAYDTIGNSVDINESFATAMSVPINFGSDPEPLALTRLIAPKHSRSFVLANPTNYVIFLEKFNYFSSVIAYSNTNDAYLDDDNIVYLLLIPDINKRISSVDNYFTVPESYFTLTDFEKNKVINLIEESNSKITTSVVKIIDPKVSRFVINISLIVYKGYSIDSIKANIIQTCSNYFLGLRRRDIIPKSELISIIQNLQGIDSVSINYVSEIDEFNAISGSTIPTNLDEFGNILIPDKESIVLIRGGFSDRNGVFYENSISDNVASSVNIHVASVMPKDFSSEL